MAYGHPPPILDYLKYILTESVWQLTSFLYYTPDGHSAASLAMPGVCRMVMFGPIPVAEDRGPGGDSQPDLAPSLSWARYASAVGSGRGWVRTSGRRISSSWAWVSRPFASTRSYTLLPVACASLAMAVAFS